MFNLVSGRRGSTSSDKKRSKSRARSKSPFRSFRWPKSKSRPEQAGSYSDDEDNVSPRSTLRKYKKKDLAKINLRSQKRSKNTYEGLCYSRNTFGFLKTF